MELSHPVEISSETSSQSGIVFFIQVYGERVELIRCWRAIRRVYPSSRIIVRFDGDNGDKAVLAEMFSDPRLEVEDGERLFGVEHGGMVVQRMLELFLAGPGDFLVKVDADTDVKGKIVPLPSPDEPYIGGRVQSDSIIRSIQGGCIIISRAACTLFVDSEILCGEELKPPALSWARSANPLFRAHVMRLTSHDWVIGYAAQKLNVPVSEHPRVLSFAGAIPIEQYKRYYSASVVHPRMKAFLGMEPIFGVFSASNLRRLVRGEWRSSVKHTLESPQYKLRLNDFDSWNLPPQVIVWLVNNLPEGSAILELGSGKSSRELSRCFKLVSIEEDVHVEQLAQVEYIFAPISNCYYAPDAVMTALSGRRYDAVIVDGPKAYLPGRSSIRLGFLNYVEHIHKDSLIVIDDVQRLAELCLFLRLLWRRPNFRLFFWLDKATIILSPGPVDLKRFIRNSARVLLGLVPIVAVHTLNSLRAFLRNIRHGGA